MPNLMCFIALTLGCAGSDGVGLTELADIEWARIPWAQGNTNVAFIRADPASGPGPHPVVFALPWGAGDAPLVLSMIDAYWDREPGARGYHVVVPEIRGSTLEETADEVIPAIFEWMDGELSYDQEKVVLAGASNGGRGVFFTAVALPERFAAFIGMPGRYVGDGGDLAPLVGKPVWLLVGEFDDGWLESTETTRQLLEDQGVEVTANVVPGQGHVLSLSQGTLMDWIETALGR